MRTALLVGAVIAAGVIAALLLLPPAPRRLQAAPAPAGHGVHPAPAAPAEAVRARSGETLVARVDARAVLRRSPSGPAIATVGPQTEFGARTFLAVVAQRGHWVGVLAPQAGNGHTGWLPVRHVTLLRDPWSLEIRTAARELIVRKRGAVRLRTPVAVGRPATPTPHGRFAVSDVLIVDDAGSPYGCCALALTARQPSIPQGWGGGDRIAIHATPNLQSIGTAASLGCIRTTDRVMRRLMRTVPPGTRVRIRA